MADAELNFRQSSFLSEFQILLVFLLPKSFYTKSKISVKRTSIYTRFV